MKHHFFLPEYINAFDLDQIYMACSMWHDTGKKDLITTFDLVVRDMPKNRNFLVFTGLEEMVLFLKNFKFTEDQIKVLKKYKLISEDFGKYLRKIRFTGDMVAMKEGTFFFPGEPVIRITAPIIEANLFTAFFMTSLSSNTIFSSKYIRPVIAAKHINVIGPSPNRAHAFEASMKAQRGSYIVGSMNGPSPIVRHLFGYPMGDNATIAYHAFIKSYGNEIDAMKVASKHAKVDLSLMVDTYDYKTGIKNAIEIAKEYSKQNRVLKLVVDSGDLYKGAVMVKKAAQKAGLKNVKVTVASNLDEYKIEKLVKKKIPADTFIVNTEAITSSDDPKLEVVYKMSEMIFPDGKVVNKMKLSKGKVSLPGKKEVFRKYAGEKWTGDVIGLQGEKGNGQSLYISIFKKGKLVYKLPNILQIREYVENQLKLLPKKYLEISRNYTYPVRLSERLRSLMKKTRKEILNH